LIAGQSVSLCRLLASGLSPLRAWQLPESVFRYSTPLHKARKPKAPRRLRTVIDPTRSVETNLGKHLPFPFGCNSLLDDELTLVVVEFHPHGLYSLPNKLEAI
jgi:hypothetical protein